MRGQKEKSKGVRCMVVSPCKMQQQFEREKRDRRAGRLDQTSIYPDFL